MFMVFEEIKRGDLVTRQGHVMKHVARCVIGEANGSKFVKKWGQLSEEQFLENYFHILHSVVMLAVMQQN